MWHYVALAVIQKLFPFYQLAKMAYQLDQHVLNPEKETTVGLGH